LQISFAVVFKRIFDFIYFDFSLHERGVEPKRKASKAGLMRSIAATLLILRRIISLILNFDRW
jgi:hypothetical protein